MATVLAALFVASSLIGGPAWAQEAASQLASPLEPSKSTNRSPFDINLGVDLTLIFVPPLLAGFPYMAKDEFNAPRCLPDCDSSKVIGIDQPYVGRWNKKMAHISDYVLLTSLGLPHLLGAIDVAVSDPEDGWEGYLKDEIILFQTLSITLGATALMGLAIDRPRPFVYNENVSLQTRSEGDAATSFPSGHTSLSFSMATAYSIIYTKRHPDSGWVAPLWIFTHGLAATAAALRVEAGKHYPTDIVGGAVLGSAIGLLVPLLHFAAEDNSLEVIQE